MAMTGLTAAALALALCAPAGWFHRGTIHPGGRIVPPGPGYGWGFPNGNPDGYGWVDYGTMLPLGADRTPEYYFPRYYALPPVQLFPSTFYNPYVMRGQRYIAYTACGGAHPLGGPTPFSSETPIRPSLEAAAATPTVTPPAFSGRSEAAPVPSGGSGLIP
jgi:hypothetical protein